MPKWKPSWLLLVVGLLLAACRPAAAQSTATPVQATHASLPQPEMRASPTSPLPPEMRASSTSPALMPSSTSPPPTASPTESPRTPTSTSFSLCSPLAEESIPDLWQIVSDPYAPPPPGHEEERHHGVDFSHYRRRERQSIEGEGIQAVLPGVVAASVADRLPYGNMLIVETRYETLPPTLSAALSLPPGDSLYLLYAHFLAPPALGIGAEVTCGETLGAVGATGYNVINPHLHLETRYGASGRRFPEGLVFYDTSASPAQMENYRRWRTSGEFTHFDPMSLFAAYLDLRGEPLPESAATPAP